MREIIAGHFRLMFSADEGERLNDYGISSAL
jgi:hypothetical protein